MCTWYNVGTHNRGVFYVKSVVFDSAETREHWDYNAEYCISISALVAEILRFEVFGWLPWKQ